MKKAKLRCLGCGDGLPCNDRKHASYLYTINEIDFLIDCGEPVCDTLQEAGYDFNSLDRIFISHMHSDHVGGFFMLMQGFWLEGRTKALPIHMPKDGIEPIVRMMEAGCLFEELFRFKPSYYALDSNTATEFGGVRVTPFNTTHLNGFKKSFQDKYKQSYEAFCFLIEGTNIRIGHSADIGAPEDLAPILAEPVDLLVCELAHCELEDLFDYLSDKPVDRIAFMHLGRSWWSHIGEVKSIAQRRLKDKQVTFLCDGMVLTI
ncbi:MAG: MBL fold metallo-hydrolase [Verrucomicrobia bacterium]|nr:MBL fold metallo-hydrolase [Verrucomicrobiota bacterium]MCF7707387.1 MBL fold metallo-hydrolase [Verrucomicrobiota bacterium]